MVIFSKCSLDFGMLFLIILIFDFIIFLFFLMVKIKFCSFCLFLFIWFFLLKIWINRLCLLKFIILVGDFFLKCFFCYCLDILLKRLLESGILIFLKFSKKFFKYLVLFCYNFCEIFFLFDGEMMRNDFFMFMNSLIFFLFLSVWSLCLWFFLMYLKIWVLNGIFFLLVIVFLRKW